MKRVRISYLSRALYAKIYFKIQSWEVDERSEKQVYINNETPENNYKIIIFTQIEFWHSNLNLLARLTHSHVTVCKVCRFDPMFCNVYEAAVTIKYLNSR